MNTRDFYVKDGEKPLDRLVPDGGFCRIFRKMAFIGDSLSSGEFESTDESGNLLYHDIYEYAWGAYLGRMCGSEVINFSMDAMTVSEYCETFAESRGYWDKSLAAQCYFIALGVNDVTKVLNGTVPAGSIDDVDLSDPENNKKTFAGYYAQIIGRYKKISPRAKFFLVMSPYEPDLPKDYRPFSEERRKIIKDIADAFENTYVIDLYKYAPDYDAEFKKKYFLGYHMTPSGYVLTAKYMASYVDFIIRQNPADFAEVQYIGTELHHKNAKEIKL